MSGPIEVRPLSGAADFTTFIQLPRRLYRGMPGWVAPLDFDRRKTFDPRKNPFFRHADSARFLAWRDGKPVGRVSAQIDRLHIERYDDATGHFGCLDAIDDAPVVKALLGAAEDWLRARGMRRINGPFNPSINAEMGMLIEGHAHRPMFLVSWNPPYLAGHVAAAGYGKAVDTYDYDFDIGREPTSYGTSMLKRSELAGRITVRGPRLTRVRQEVRTVLGVFNDAWQRNWGFVPFTVEEMDALASEMQPVLRKDSAVIIEVDGKAAAFIFAVPNLLEVIAGYDGRLLPLHWLHLAWSLFTRRFRTSRVPLMGVVSAYQGSPLGAGLAMLAIEELHRLGKRRGIETVELGWILEENMAMRRMIERIGGVKAKTYRIFERSLAT
ncbi:MAG: hypothetical protein KF889_27515 [Alphaproteobacteria bacterium]|nr:hypothetical protein [Alphaproteobacteria bacterium]MCW5738741.1 hypothetical protein [Alphaproteobacteria bacterium]